MKNIIKTKSGLASLYLVAFTTLLVGITTLSFARIMISESREASNADLSQSAYDSALAGIEDAKVALLRYHECISENHTRNDGTTCGSLIAAMEDGIANSSCDVVSNVLGRETTDGEVIIQETYDNLSDDDDNFGLDQAYTCVKITEESEDYRSRLTTASRVRVIPIRTKDYASIAGIQLQWHAVADSTADTMYSTISGDGDVLKFATKNVAATSAPVLTFDLYQTDQRFRIYELDLNNNNNTGTDHAMITLYPYNGSESGAPNRSGQEHGGNGTLVTARNLLDSSNKDNSVALGTTDATQSLTPKPVSCGYTDGYRCRTTIQFPATYKGTTTVYNPANAVRAESTFFLRLTLPYGVSETDFRIVLCTAISADGDCTTTTFSGVQAVVDSTGRASTLYRRILSRIELVDLNYPYPEFAIQLNGTDDNALIEKNFYITKNCWRSDGVGGFTVCPNNGDV